MEHPTDNPALHLPWLMRPTPGRLHDFFADGHNNLWVDRELGHDLLAQASCLPPAAAANWDFKTRVTRLAARRGIHQFLELGCGYARREHTMRADRWLPTVHRTAMDATATPGNVRIVYVDHDPLVMGYARALLDDCDAVRTLEADILDMPALLTAPQISGHLDPALPVAVTLTAVAHWITDDPALHHAMDSLVTWLPPGSTLSITHATADHHPQTATALAQICTRAGLPLRLRERAEVRALFCGLPLLSPGLTATENWRPEQRAPYRSAAWAGVAVKGAPAVAR
ncbi:SAM-dependent methyltransferase [Kitasatospora kazusensis]|uniref:SAM-dependent methyltransferase n=1 Tax=Kitasatospora kazusensis TaxID=407974 RepID=A0ABN2Z4U3_9ACTN